MCRARIYVINFEYAIPEESELVMSTNGMSFITDNVCFTTVDPVLVYAQYTDDSSQWNQAC